MKPIVIIGSGLAGYVLAKEFRKVDQTTPLTIVTSSGGNFYSKPLLSSAFTHKRDLAALMTASVQEMAEQLYAEILPYTTVVQIQPDTQQILLADHHVIEYSRLVLATGSKPIRLPLQGDAADQAYSVNNLQDYENFLQGIQHKQRIGIIGCGLVGTEFANDLTNGGYQVTVMASDKAPLERFIPNEIGKVIQHALAEIGVKWVLERCVLAVNQLNKQIQVTLDNDQVLTFDAVLSAVGIEPNVALAQQAGIKINRAIAVDCYLQTNVNHIYALGDCAEVEGYLLQFVSPLMQSARALAKTLAGEKTAVHYPVMPIIVKTPACPTVFYPPLFNAVGNWQTTGQSTHYQAVFVDNTHQPQGFVVTGSCIKNKVQLIKQIPPLLGKNTPEFQI